MSSAANLDTNTLGVPPPATKADADELREWLDMFGLPPCERALRTSKGERNRHGDYAKRGGQ